MKVRAKYRLNVSGVWYAPGEIFEISATDTDIIEHVDIVETPIIHDHPEDEAVTEQPETPKRGRPRKEKN